MAFHGLLARHNGNNARPRGFQILEIFFAWFPLLCGLQLDNAALAAGRVVLNYDISGGLAGTGAQ